MSLPPIVELFMELVRLKAASLNESKVAAAVRSKLEALGLTVWEDGAGAAIGGDCGNIIARLPGDPNRPTLIFSAHLDRVDNHGAIQPELSLDGRTLRSDGSSILAADDVSGICAIIDGLSRVQASDKAHGPVELVLTVGEELGFLGARALDYSRLEGREAYVIDCDGPLGAVVTAAPSQYTFTILVHGRSAHAGLEPEKGLSAIRVAAEAIVRLKEGRLSPVSTANLGIFQAGRATNVVCDLAEIKGECRSHDPQALKDYIQYLKGVMAETASEFGTEIEVSEVLEYEGFAIGAQEPVVQRACRALEKLGLKPHLARTGGGLDANIFNHRGLRAVGLAPGYANVHSPRETQDVDSLVNCGLLVSEIIWDA